MKDIEFKLSEQGNAIYVCCDGEKVDRTNDILTVVRDYLMDKMVDMNQSVGVRWTADDIGSVILALHVRTPEECCNIEQEIKKRYGAPGESPVKESQKEGKWVDDGYGSYILVCSNCGSKPQQAAHGGIPMYGLPCPKCDSVNKGGKVHHG